MSYYVFATQLAVSPTRLYVTPNEPITTFTLTNQSVTTVLIQVIPKKWLAHSSQIITNDTQDFIVSPLIFHLPPKKTQLIRLAYQGNFDSQLEKPYRLIIQEIPEQTSNSISRLTILLQLSLPIFIEPLTTIDEQLLWELVKKKGDPHYRLIAKNKGNNIILIDGVTLINKKGRQKLTSSDNLAYIFPGDHKTWQIPDSPQGIEAFVNQKKQQFKVNAHPL
jgi:fimbrial chaperone protein